MYWGINVRIEKMSRGRETARQEAERNWKFRGSGLESISSLWLNSCGGTGRTIKMCVWQTDKGGKTFYWGRMELAPKRPHMLCLLEWASSWKWEPTFTKKEKAMVETPFSPALWCKAVIIQTSMASEQETGSSLGSAHEVLAGQIRSKCMRTILEKYLEEDHARGTQRLDVMVHAVDSSTWEGKLIHEGCKNKASLSYRTRDDIYHTMVDPWVS